MVFVVGFLVIAVIFLFLIVGNLCNDILEIQKELDKYKFERKIDNKLMENIVIDIDMMHDEIKDYKLHDNIN